MTRILPQDLDFTARDFDALRTRLFRAIRSVFPKWSDDAVANFGNLIVEGEAFTGDVKAFYQDSQAREAFLVTASQLVNGLRHARRNSYIPREPTAATVTLQVTLSEVAAKDVPWPAGSIVRSKSPLNPVKFQTLTDATVLAGTQTISVSAENSETKIEIFEATERADFEILLEFTPFLVVQSITDATGIWATTPVASFLDSAGTDKDWRLFRNDENRGLIRFGDATNGKIPVGDVTTTYKIGGGQVTVEQNTLEIPEFTLSDIDGNPVQFTVTNPSDSVGGTNRESLKEIQVNAPEAVRVNERSVTSDDFAINARRVSDVARALMLTSDDVVGIAENFGQLYIVAFGSETAAGNFKAGTPTQAILDAVRSKIDNDFPPTITFDYDVLSAVFLDVDVTARVFLEEGASAATVDTAIREALEDFLAVADSDRVATTAVGFGVEFKDADGDPDPFLAWSDIFNAVRDTTGVRKVDKSSFRPLDDVALALNEFPRLGTVTLLDAETGLPLV